VPVTAEVLPVTCPIVAELFASETKVNVPVLASVELAIAPIAAVDARVKVPELERVALLKLIVDDAPVVKLPALVSVKLPFKVSVEPEPVVLMPPLDKAKVPGPVIVAVVPLAIVNCLTVDVPEAITMVGELRPFALLIDKPAIFVPLGIDGATVYDLFTPTKTIVDEVGAEPTL
jgi:hypothetical protein